MWTDKASIQQAKHRPPLKCPLRATSLAAARPSTLSRTPRRRPSCWRSPQDPPHAAFDSEQGGAGLGLGLGSVRWQRAQASAQALTSSPYDKEIWGVALPALLAMLLEPVQSAINAGGREGLDWGLQWPHVACGCPPDYMLDQIWSVHSHVLCRMAVFFLTQPWSGTWVLSS